MKISFKQFLYTFILGSCCGITIISFYSLYTGNLPWLKAAGVGTGSSDVNARYWNGADWDDDISLTGTTTLGNVDWANSDDGAGSGLDADLLDGESWTQHDVTLSCTTVTNSCAGDCYTLCDCPSDSIVTAYGCGANEGYCDTLADNCYTYHTTYQGHCRFYDRNCIVAYDTSENGAACIAYCCKWAP